MGQPVKISEVPVRIVSKVKKCSVCGKKIKGYHKNEKGKILIIRPIYDCNCKEERIRRKKLEDNRVKISLLINKSRIDKKFLNNNYDVYHSLLKPYFDKLDWVDKGKNLLVYGYPGNHKTGQITQIMKKVIYEKFRSVRYYRTSSIIYQRDMQAIENCFLLVLDNFGKDVFEKSRNAVFDLIDSRIHNYRSTILITNAYNPDEVESIYDLPMISRLKMFEKIGPIGEEGKDLRSEKDQEDYNAVFDPEYDPDEIPF